MSQPGVEIRAPAATEMQSIFDLRWRGLYEPLGLTQKMLKEQSYPADDDPRTLHVAAFVGNKPVSTVRVEQHPEHGDYVSLMATEQAWRDRGVGRTVLLVAEQRARNELDIDLLRLHASPDAVGFYEKIGYQKDGRNRTGQTTRGEIVYIGMEKVLK